MQDPQTISPSAPLRRPRIVPLVFGIFAVAVLILAMSFMVTQQQAGPDRGGDIEHISLMGERVEITRNLVPGKYTVVDFYADWCENCQRITPILEELTRRHGNVALRKINIVNWDTPVVAQYNVTFLPYLQVYGPNGALMADGMDATLATLQNLFPDPG